MKSWLIYVTFPTDYISDCYVGKIYQLIEVKGVVQGMTIK